MIGNHTLSDKFSFVIMTIISVFSFYSGYKVFASDENVYHNFRNINEDGVNIEVEEISFPEFIINGNRKYDNMID